MATTVAEPANGVRAGVLVVGERDGIARSVPEVLMRAGHWVVAVESAAAGLREVCERSFNCMVVALQLPDLRGDVFVGLARVHQPRLGRRTVFLAREMAEATWLSEVARYPVFWPPFDVDQFLSAVVRSMAGT